MASYIDTNETMFPDGYERERLFRSAGDMLSPARLEGAGLFRRIYASLRDWRMRRAGRLVLREMDEDCLRDIGLTRAEAQREVAKSFFWD